MTYNGMAHALMSKGQLTEAIETFEKSLELNDSNVSTLTNLGNAYKDYGRVEKAIGTYMKALSIAPNVSIQSNVLMAMHYSEDVNREELFAAHRRWNELYAAPLLPKDKAYRQQQ